MRPLLGGGGERPARRRSWWRAGGRQRRGAPDQGGGAGIARRPVQAASEAGRGAGRPQRRLRSERSRARSLRKRSRKASCRKRNEECEEKWQIQKSNHAHASASGNIDELFKRERAEYLVFDINELRNLILHRKQYTASTESIECRASGLG